MTRVRLQQLLALIPALGLLAAPLVANRVEPRILGLPFLLAWIVFWVVAASVCMTIVGKIERSASQATHIADPHEDTR